MTYVPTPEEIRRVRLAAGLTMEEAADLAGLGHLTRWYEYEAGSRRPTPVRWAYFMGAIETRKKEGRP